MSNLISRFPKPSGRVILTLRDLQGNVVYEYAANNLVVTDARELVTDLVGGTTTEVPDEIAVGSGGHEVGDPNIPVPPTVSDATLETEDFRKVIGTKSQPTPTEAQFQVVYATTEANSPGSITEAGLFTPAASNDILFARVTFPEIVKTAILTLTITWKIIF